jgi:hypothetical protein
MHNVSSAYPQQRQIWFQAVISFRPFTAYFIVTVFLAHFKVRQPRISNSVALRAVLDAL